MYIPKSAGYSGIPAQNANLPATEKTVQKQEAVAATAETDVRSKNKQDVFVGENGKTHKAAYTKGDSVIKMKNDAVRDWVKKSFAEQASGIKSGYKPRSSSPIIADALAAAEKTSEKYDDFWGVDATAERIYTFARTLAGDNDEMFSTMKNAFLKGFKAAAGERGSLPEISYKTKDKVLGFFDEWEKEIAAKKSPPVSDATS